MTTFAHRFRIAALILLSVTAVVTAQTPALPFETLFYQHDGLKLEAYLYQPEGKEPFPLVVYNHGSAERDEWPAPFVARMLVPAGYAVLVPERRGYGKSEGRTFSEEIGQDRGPRFLERQRAEAGDINTAVEFVLSRTGSTLDPKRVVIMGWSFGGIVTTLAAGASPRYAAVMVQAPGALNWDRSAEMRSALTEAASKVRVPVSCAVAENDATTESARAICAAANAAGAATTPKVYPSFTSGKERPGNSPGHALFGAVGASVWQKDALDFLASVTRTAAQTAPLAPPDQYFDSAGVQLRFVEQGTGPAIVLMHGYTGTLDRHFIANGVFASLANYHRVIAMDLRGHGKSAKPHDPRAYGEEMSRDVVRLLDHLKIQRAHVLGYSLGAMIAGRLATMHPERLLSVVYVASLPLRTGDASIARFAEESVKELESDLPFKSLMIGLQPPGSSPPSDDEVRKAVAPLVAANDLKSLAALWRGYETLAVSDQQLRTVSVPSIVITGSEDISAAGVPALNKSQPQILTVIVPGAQHGGPEGVMRRREFTTTLHEFLAKAK
jgi:pimeloyl-ACP methyl ester carboxylesterase